MYKKSNSIASRHSDTEGEFSRHGFGPRVLCESRVLLASRNQFGYGLVFLLYVHLLMKGSLKRLLAIMSVEWFLEF